MEIRMGLEFSSWKYAYMYNAQDLVKRLPPNLTRGCLGELLYSDLGAEQRFTNMLINFHLSPCRIW